MKLPHFILLLFLLTVNFSCEKKRESAAYDKLNTENDSSWTNTISSEAAKVNNDSDRSFIRTADLKFKVENARTASQQIENLIIDNGGFITKSYLRSENIRSRKVSIIQDSAIRLTQYYLTSDIEFRVPSDKLHTTLMAIGQHAKFIDYRIIEAKDKTWDILQNNTQQKRLQRHANRLENKITKQKDKIIETNEALDNLLEKEEQLDNAELNQKIWSDEIAYSTVKINFYENEQLLKEYEASENYYSDFKPGFMQQASTSWNAGLAIAETILLLLIRLFPLLVLILAIIVASLVIKKKLNNYFNK